MHLNQPYQPRLCVCNSKESLVHNEASETNLDAYKTIYTNLFMFRFILLSTVYCALQTLYYTHRQYYYPRFIVPYRLYTIRIGSIIIRGLLFFIDFILYVSAVLLSAVYCALQTLYYTYRQTPTQQFLNSYIF